MRLAATFVLALALSLVGCATGSLTEKTPVTKDLGAYHSASVAVTVTGKTNKPDVHKSQCEIAVGKAIKDLFTQVVPEGGELVVKVTLDKVDEGMSIQALGAEGEVDLGASVELWDAKENHGIGAFAATGTSKRASKTTVQGMPTDNTGKSALAHQALAEQIGSYIASHRAK